MTATADGPRIKTAHPTSPAGMSKEVMRRELMRDTDIDHANIDLMERVDLERQVIASRLAKGDGKRDSSIPLDTKYDADLMKTQVGYVVSSEPAVMVPVLIEEEDDFDDLADLLDDNPADDLHNTADEAAELLDVLSPLIEDIAASAEPDDVADLLDEIEQAQPKPLFLGLPEVLDYRFDGHAGAGPSGAERWMNCTASLGAVREFLETLTPRQQQSYASGGGAARQGTTAHAAAEADVLLLLGRITPDEHDATIMELTLAPVDASEAYDEEMAEYLTEYTDFVQSFIDAGHPVEVEARVQALIPLTVEGAYTHIYDDGDTLPDYYSIDGSADLSVYPIPSHPRLTVGDLKYGNGIDVDVEANPQTRFYMLGLLAKYIAEGGNLDDIEGLDYAIIQPRLGGIKVWTESVDDLLAWRDEVASPALTSALGLDGNAVYAPGDTTCQWCPVRGSCAALTTQRVEAAADLFDVIVAAEFEGHDIETGLPNTAALDNDTLGALLKQVSDLVGLKDDLKAEAERRLHRGDAVPGYQLVSYTPARSWKPNAATDETLGALPVWKPQTMLTPTQALKAVGPEKAALLDPFIEVPDKRPIIGREGDRRKTWTGKPPEQMFDVE